MSKILIYAGTTEGRELSEILLTNGIPCTVSVATEYGNELMVSHELLDQQVGRKNKEQMLELAKNGEYALVVDATHPYAVEASRNIKESTILAGLPYLRLQRECHSMSKDTPFQRVESSEQCVEFLRGTEGRIFLTTGAKELPIFCQDEKLRERLVVRVLPGEESLGICREQGLVGKQIIAMQGPFIRELNEAILRQYDIRYMVTKESGKNGGFQEKIEAAENCGVKTLVIANPELKVGLNFEETLEKIEKLTGQSISYICSDDIRHIGKNIPESKEIDCPREKNRMKISLIGIGPGNKDFLTGYAKEKIEKADYLFGADRMIESFEARKRKYSLYLAKDILPILDEIFDNYGENNEIYIAILFSGDTGFYSGCKKMQENLLENGYFSVEIIPGISSISYMSAKSGISWDDAVLYSIHGKGTVERWKSEFISKVLCNSKMFLILSGLQDMLQVGELLSVYGLDYCKLWIGYELSYDREQCFQMLPSEVCALKDQGLYSCIVVNPRPEKSMLSHHMRDEAFIRDKVPMTKAEVRTLSIAKLGLYEKAIVYDIGSGTGSIAVEIAKHSPSIQVYAIECKEEAVDLIRKNGEKFQLDNIQVINGLAPDALEGLEEPTHVFIGGSKGNLKAIIEKLKRYQGEIRLVINAVSLETIEELVDVAREYPEAEFVQLQVSRGKKIGAYHMMQAENPVMICSMTIKGA